MYQAKYKIKIIKKGYDETIKAVSLNLIIHFKNLSKKNNILSICLGPWSGRKTAMHNIMSIINKFTDKI